MSRYTFPAHHYCYHLNKRGKRWRWITWMRWMRCLCNHRLCPWGSDYKDRVSCDRCFRRLSLNDSDFIVLEVLVHLASFLPSSWGMQRLSTNPFLWSKSNQEWLWSNSCYSVELPEVISKKRKPRNVIEVPISKNQPLIKPDWSS